MGAADEFADAWDEEIHGGDGFAVVVGAHVEGFDFFGVVEEGDGFFRVVFGEPAFVFALEVLSVGDGVLEGLFGLEEDIDGVGVGNSLEGCGGDGLEA